MCDSTRKGTAQLAPHISVQIPIISTKVKGSAKPTLLLWWRQPKKNRTHPAGEGPKVRAAMNPQTGMRENPERRREECATAERKTSHNRERTFRFRFPSLPPYEEHNIDILRKNRVFTRFFAPFWHFEPVTKNHETQIFSGFWWGCELMSSDF